MLRYTTPSYVLPLVGRWGPHFISFFLFLRSLASVFLPKFSNNSNTAPAHPHATGEAVYPALFLSSRFFICRNLRQNVFCRPQCFNQSQYRYGRVGRGILPPSTPHAPLTYTKNHLKCSFSHFSTHVHEPTDQPTDRQTDKASYRVACPQLKTPFFPFNLITAWTHIWL